MTTLSELLANLNMPQLVLFELKGKELTEAQLTIAIRRRSGRPVSAKVFTSTLATLESEGSVEDAWREDEDGTRSRRFRLTEKGEFVLLGAGIPMP
jgi:DNA-binding PadR family transcriptional regulator